MILYFGYIMLILIEYMNLSSKLIISFSRIKGRSRRLAVQPRRPLPRGAARAAAPRQGHQVVHQSRRAGLAGSPVQSGQHAGPG